VHIPDVPIDKDQSDHDQPQGFEDWSFALTWKHCPDRSAFARDGVAIIGIEAPQPTIRVLLTLVKTQVTDGPALQRSSIHYARVPKVSPGADAAYNSVGGSDLSR
jgi:hypothetical protein